MINTMNENSSFNPEEGLKTLQPLLQHLEQHPEELEGVSAVIAALESLERALWEAKRHNLKWTIEVE